MKTDENKWKIGDKIMTKCVQDFDEILYICRRYISNYVMIWQN